VKVLVELRPAFEGHAGIPQETRLLFRGLQQLDSLQVDGMLQSSSRLLAKGLPADAAARNSWPVHKQFNRLSRVVVSAQPGRRFNPLDIARATFKFTSSLFGRTSLTTFDPNAFRDFVWRNLFARTLPSSDFDAVTRTGYRVLQLPWNGMHYGALATRWLCGRPLYPRLDTSGYDVLVAETPFPGRVSPATRLVVRYHDAIPILMPHSIVDREHHQASHYHALHRNVQDGAWFACVSEATRRDLISIFPQAEAKAVTIPNMVSHHYYPDDTGPQQIPEILRVRKNQLVPASGAATPMVVRDGQAMPYLLMVSTIEPRKNHLTLLSAWEHLRTQGFADLNLVFVGALGWDHKAIVKRLQPWLARGGLHMLEDVPSDELRLLYRHARATVCPSFGEGFDYSGIESMRCGGVVAASDIPVHRGVFGDAAEYFSPYSERDAAAAIARLIGPGSEARRRELAATGETVAAQYLPERVLPQWQAFLNSLASKA
jgi:glycosyltransferase involved in cell wall biosynthesis